MRVFIYEEGLARFCTEQYQVPNNANISEKFMHLTNYAINKESPNFIFNENEECDSIGHKRSLTSLFETLEKRNVDVDTLWSNIHDIIIKTL
jgi:tubulin polyglutamylase TTLL6/13